MAYSKLSRDLYRLEKQREQGTKTQKISQFGARVTRSEVITKKVRSVKAMTVKNVSTPSHVDYTLTDSLG